jgi:serine/threonine-protein kinase
MASEESSLGGNDICLVEDVEFAVDGFVVANRYLLGRKIGSGGMGSVWLAYDQSLDRVCAVKIVDPDKASSIEVRKRFLREARATAQIRSVHVVEVFEHGVWDGLPFIVMELLDGEELGTRLDRLGVLEPNAAHRVVAQIARGLARAHALGIVHRDLKPENIFLVPRDGEEIVKVLDFGIAHHVVYSPRDRATKAGAVMGTPCYMSPEQALGERTDWRADLWSLAVLSFQCLTGKLPFFHEAIGGLLTQILYEPIPSIREANPALSEAVEAWWRKASQRDPEHRFQSAAELSDALAVALGIEEPLVVPPVVPCSEALRVDVSDFDDAPGSAFEYAARMGSDAPVAMNTGDLITQFRRRVRRRSAWGWVVAGALVSATLGAGVLFRDRLLPSRAASEPDRHELVPAISVRVASPPPPPSPERSIETAPVTVSPQPETSAAPPTSSPDPSASTTATQRRSAPTRRTRTAATADSAPVWSEWTPEEPPKEKSVEPPPERVRERQFPRLGPSPPRGAPRPPPRTRDYGI